MHALTPKSRLSRRAALGLVAGAGGAAAIVACAPQTGGAPAVSAGPVQPKAGGTLRVALGGNPPPNLEGHDSAGATLNATSPFYDRLVEYDDKGQLKGKLAETFELSGDAKQLKLSLRKGVQFHNGRELTSDDIRFNITRSKTPGLSTSGTLIAMSGWWTGVETPDKYTVVLKSEQPRPTVWDYTELLQIVDKDATANKPIGTGPFQLAEYLPNTSVKYARNKSYWQSGRPLLDGIDLNIQSDLQAGVVRFESGAVDVFVGPPARDSVRLKADARYQLVLNPNSVSLPWLGFNTTVAPTSDKRFRQALSYAVDRKRINENVNLGLGVPQNLPWPKSSAAYDEAKSTKFAFDLDKAKALLKDAGVTTAEIEIEYFAGADAIPQILQGDFAKIGVKLNLKAGDPLVVRQNYAQVKYKNVYMSSTSATLTDPITFLSGVFFGATGNGSGFNSDRYKQLTTQGAVEPDPAKRKQIFSDINDLLNDEQFGMVATLTPSLILAGANVKGYAFRANGQTHYAELWLNG